MGGSRGKGSPNRVGVSSDEKPLEVGPLGVFHGTRFDSQDYEKNMGPEGSREGTSGLGCPRGREGGFFWCPVV